MDYAFFIFTFYNRVNAMKQINKKTRSNTQSKKAFTKKLATLLAGLFIGGASATSVQTIEIIKAEPIKAVSLISDAKSNLNGLFNGLTLNTQPVQLTVKNMIAKESVKANNTKQTTVTKIALVAE